MTQIPFSVDLENEEWFVNWENGFKLIKFESPNFNLNGKECIVSIGELIQLRDVVILGEPGSGLKRLLKSIKMEMSKEIVSYVIINGDFLDNGSLEFSKNIEEINKAKVTEMLKHVFENSSGTDAILKEWAKGIHGTCHLIFEKLTPEYSLKIAGAMRLIRESKEDYQTSLLVLFTSAAEDAFLEHALQSAYLDYCTVLRLSRFNKEETCSLVEKSLKLQNIDAECLSHIIQYTGGHPALVKDFIGYISDIMEFDEQLDINTLNIAFDEMVKGSTFFIEKWESYLQILVSDKPDLKSSLTRYLRETIQPEHLPPPMKDRPLFVAGWVGFDSKGHWGIVSEFHKVVITKVLGKEPI